MSVDVSIHSARGVDSLEALRSAVIELVESADVAAVVVGHEPNSFDDVVFAGSTPARTLDECAVPIVLVSRSALTAER